MDPETPDEIRSLPRRQSPPPWLEERIVAELKTRGRIHRTPPAHRRLAVAIGIAASILLFASGLAAGRFLNSPPDTGSASPRFILLLYEDDAYQAPASDEDRVSEYRDWAGELGTRGLFVGGEKLKDAADSLPAGGASPQAQPGTLAGYFIITAGGRSEAIAIARDCPHLKYGGKIVVREIDPT